MDVGILLRSRAELHSKLVEVAFEQNYAGRAADWQLKELPRVLNANVDTVIRVNNLKGAMKLHCQDHYADQRTWYHSMMLKISLTSSKTKSIQYIQ